MYTRAFLRLLSSFLLFSSTPWALAQNSSSSSVGQNASSPVLPTASAGHVLNPAVDDFIGKILSDWGSSGGVAIAVVRMDAEGNWTVEKKGYGNATLNGTKVTEDTRFGIGSNSKLFDVVATGLLMHNTSITPPVTWRTKISSIIKEWELEDPIATEHATILDLMSHRTGLPRHDLMYGYNDTIPSLIERLKYLQPSAEFRDIWQYTNTMYMVLSSLPTHLLKHKPPFARYVKDNIFVPLGLKDTTYSFEIAKASGLMAESFAREGVDVAANPLAPGTPRPVPWLFHGEDGNTLLLGGLNPETGAEVIPSEVLSTVATGVLNLPGVSPWPEVSPTVYGGGQMSFSYRGHDIIEHGGKVSGFNTQIARLPSDGLGIAVFTNDDTYGGFFMDIIKFYLIDRALGLEPIDWNGRSSFVKPRFLPVVPLVFPGPPATPRPADAKPPTGGFGSLAGQYSNPGYGSYKFCYIPPNTTGSHSIAPPSNMSSTNCNDLISSLPTLLPGALDPTIPTYISRWDKAFDFVVFSHFDGDLFNATGLSGYVRPFSLISTFSLSDHTSTIQYSRQWILRIHTSPTRPSHHPSPE
ncbi:beta-lactamase/transpeptidase-like protein [Pluteus cervinus]|uniref:Beta-lactamase/transpeptidase-like protein n=1 Tax=Pluteus cervinus TaxID=181527 RepID=A0ACD3AZ09_9AGAR|nr:beta-lactamase/transpeptidase-like protein [Pluteus cervinus]